MELWLIYAIIAALFGGIASFGQKIAVEYKTDVLYLILAQSLGMVVISSCGILLSGKNFLIEGNAPWIIFLALILSSSQFFNTRIRAEILKYLSSSEYFISFRILTVAFLTGFGIFVFREVISVTQFIGLIIGSCGIVLLFEEDARLQHSRNWSRAIYLLFLSIVHGSIIQLSAKYLTLATGDIMLILFYEGFFLLILSYIFYKKRILSLLSHTFRLSEINISLLFGISIYIAAICNFLAFYYNGPVGIVTKIMGYSVFIPIVLSILFYREKLSIKKGVALVLTIISIYYLS